MKRILVVDDERNIHYSFRRIFKGRYEVLSAYDPKEGMRKLREDQPDLVLLDVKMPYEDGIEVLRRIRDEFPMLPVIVMTAFGTTETAINAMKLEAYDYLLKPFDVEAFSELVAKALEVRGFLESIGGPKSPLPSQESELVGQSVLMQEVYKMIGRLARTDATVLLWGESGTGKELVAKKIHEHSSRKDSTMVAINCAAIPESLIESELFGHEKDAFTGAAARKKGLFEVADGSTLFLDEVGELSLPIQAKLLRFFQEREIYRVGGKEPVQLDVRIVAATNLDLEEALKRGTFREDLYYRLNVVRLNLPPLRARRQDIPLLVEHFLGKFRSELANPYLHITQETMDVLLAYTWPGNVRELENTLREAGLKARGGKITPLELSIPPYTLDLDPEASGTGQEEPFEASLERFLMKNPGTAFDRLEEATVRRALEISKGNQVKTAQLLGITRNVLRHRIKRYHILKL